MNRAEKASKYLTERLETFAQLEDFRDRKNEFFPAVQVFREETLANLREFKIFEECRLTDLDTLLAEIDTYKTKGRGGEVYWSRVSLPFKKVMQTLSGLRGYAKENQIPLRTWIRDYLTDRSVIGQIFITIVAGLILAFIIYLITVLV